MESTVFTRKCSMKTGQILLIRHVTLRVYEVSHTKPLGKYHALDNTRSMPLMHAGGLIAPSSHDIPMFDSGKQHGSPEQSNTATGVPLEPVHGF